jgi:hypothetical protein
MDGAAGEENDAALRVTLDPRLKLEFDATPLSRRGGKVYPIHLS